MRYSWKKALVHGVLAMALIIVVCLAFVVAGSVKDPERFGEGMARFILFGGVAGFGLSYLWQIGRRRLVAGLSLGGVGVIAAIVVAALVVRGQASEPLTRAEKVGLVTDAGRLSHPALGYSIVAPGDKYKDIGSSLVSAAFSKEMDAFGYVYADQDDGRILMIIQTSLAPASKHDFEQMLSGMRRGIEPAGKMLTGGAEMKTVTDEATWHDSDGEAHMHLAGGTAHLRIDAWRRKFGGKPRMVVVVGMTADGDTLADVLASFRAG